MRSAPPNTTIKDPAKFSTDLDVMELCADLVGGRKQNKEYWGTVAVPLDPIRAVPFEGLMRTAVFLPLAGVAATFGYLGMKWGLASCAVALPLMAAIHNKVRRTVLDHLRAAAELDQGRYAAVNYLADKMGLAPKDITWGLVSELAVVYAKAWLKAEAAHKEAQAAARAAAAAEEAKRRGRSTGRYTGDRKATGAAVAASGSAGVWYAMAVLKAWGCRSMCNLLSYSRISPPSLAKGRQPAPTAKWDGNSTRPRKQRRLPWCACPGTCVT